MSMDSVDGRRLSGVSSPERTRQLRDISKDLDVALPVDVADREKMVTISTTVRRPPEMYIGENLRYRYHREEISVDESLRGFVGLDRSEVAFRTSEFLLRREVELASLPDVAIRRGLSALNDQIRMFEHLYILQSQPAAL